MTKELRVEFLARTVLAVTKILELLESSKDGKVQAGHVDISKDAREAAEDCMREVSHKSNSTARG